MLGAPWYGRPVAALCLALALAAVSIGILSGERSRPYGASARPAFSIVMRHDGHDAERMESDVVLPLEEALAVIPGVERLSASCEYGTAEVSVRFARGTDAGAAYDRLSDAAQDTHARLPSSVRRPEIRASAEEGGPTWTAAVHAGRRGPDAKARPAARIKAATMDGTGEASGEASGDSIGLLLERVVKPAFERLPGVGLVEVAGSDRGEISVEVDAVLATARGLDATGIARVLASSDLLAPGGSLRVRNGDQASIVPIVADGRLSGEREMASELVPLRDGGSVSLGSLAVVKRRARPLEAVSRIDGEPAATVAVFASDTDPGGTGGAAGDARRLSAALSAEAARLGELYGLDFSILHDEGAELSRAFSSVLRATVLGSAAVVLATVLAAGGGASIAGRRFPRFGRERLAAALVPPLALLSSAATLAVSGYGLDGRTLTGLALGLGASSDVVIIAAERLGSAASVGEGRERFRRVLPVLASGSLSSVAALVPLALLDDLAAGLSSLAAAMAVVNAATLLLTVLVLPPLALSGRRPGPADRSRTRASTRAASPLPSGLQGERLRTPGAWKGARRVSRRALAVALRLCSTRPALALAAGAAFSLAGLAAFCSRPVDATEAAPRDTVYARVDFDAGCAVEAVDSRLAEAARALAGRDGIGRVMTTARRGSGMILATLSGGASSRAVAARSLGELAVPGGFAWLARDPEGERSWTLAVYGDDGDECRRLARQAAALVASSPAVIGVALGFKPGPETLVIRPDRARMSRAGVNFISICEALRRSVYGPVAYKRASALGEADVRVSTKLPGTDSRAIERLPVPGASLPLGALAVLSRERGEARPTRVDRRRAAFIRLRTKAMEAGAAEAMVSAAIQTISRGKGYSFEFDREALQAERRLKGAAAAFALAVLLAYMACAALAESLSRPLVALAALGPALSLPAIVTSLSGRAVDASTACAFIVVSGMAINSSLHVASGLPSGKRPSLPELYGLVRSRSATLISTSLAGIAATIPFMALGDSGEFGRVLALVSATGTAASALSAAIIVPALASAAPIKKGATHG